MTRADERLAQRGGLVELLRVPAALFGAAASLRARLYDRGWLPADRVDAPVVCVGNLTAGGTGKTPMVAWVARWFEARGRRPGLVSRGYKAGAGERGDEARLLARALPDVPHVQAADRAAAARALVDQGVDVVVMDDGFQHRRLARDVDLVLVDATRPWGLPAPRGGGEPVRAHLPRGLLRESPAALARADAIVLTRADQLDPAALDALEAQLGPLAPGVPLVRAAHRARCLRDAAGRERALAELSGRAVDLASGVGNPQAFERTVHALGARVGEHRAFGDHHAYAPGDLDGLGVDGRLLVTTAKDAVKLEALRPDALALEVEIDVLSGEPVLDALLEALPPSERRRLVRSLHEGLHG